MTDIPGVLAGWEEARTNLGRKGSLKTIELRTAGQKVADALRELTTVSGGRISTALELAHDIRYREPLWYSRGHVAGVLEGLVVSLAACLERETQLREALRISYPMTPIDCFLSDLDELTILTSSEETASFIKDWLRPRKAQLRAELENDVLASSVGVGAVATEDGKT